MRGDAEVAKTCAQVLGARKTKVLGALVKGLETDDETQARRILEVINVLPDACEILCDAFESPAENVQVNAAMGIGMLGEKRAGSAGPQEARGRTDRRICAYSRGGVQSAGGAQGLIARDALDVFCTREAALEGPASLERWSREMSTASVRVPVSLAGCEG